MTATATTTSNDPSATTSNPVGPPTARNTGPAKPSSAQMVMKALASPGGALIVLALYEGIATDINQSVEHPIMPSLFTSIDRFSWRTLERHLVPSWGPTIALAAMGLVIGGVQAKRQAARLSAAR